MQEILDKYKKRALTVDDFCFIYSVGRTLVYEEIAATRLHSVKLGKKRLIPTDAAEEWFSNLEQQHNQIAA